MTDETINALVATRNRLTNRRDEQVDWGAVDLIDAILRDVPPGQRNDVDLLLGRPTAVLPPRAALQAACEENGVTEYRWLRADTVSMIEMTRIIFEAAEPIEY